MFENAAPVEDDEGELADCTGADCDGVYVRVNGEQVCRSCGHVRYSGGRAVTYRERMLSDPWRAFERIRADYSGFYGDGRVKMIGGFASAYDFAELVE